MLYALFAILAGLARQRAILTMKINRPNQDLAPSSLGQSLSADRGRDAAKFLPAVMGGATIPK